MLLHIAQNKNKREISKSSNKTHDTQIYPKNIYTNTSKYTKKSTDLPDILDVNVLRLYEWERSERWENVHCMREIRVVWMGGVKV